MALLRISRDQYIEYVNAILLRGYTKKDAYVEFINGDSKNPNQELAQMERKQDFQDVYMAIYNGDAHRLDVRAKRVREKYAKLVETTIDRTQELVEESKSEKDIGKKSQVIRLATETAVSLGGIGGNGGSPADQPSAAKINKAGVILS